MSTSGKPSLFAIFAIIITSILPAAVAQNQGQRGNGSAGPVVAGPPAVYVVSGGNGTGAYLAPTATLPSQNTGISLNNVAGISLTAPLQVGVVTAVPATAGWGYGTPGYNYGYPVYSEIMGAPTAVPSEDGGEESGRAINDLAPSYFVGTTASTSEGAAPSLAEIAARYKADHRNVRMYTNADAEKLMTGVKSGNSVKPAEHIPR